MDRCQFVTKRKCRLFWTRVLYPAAYGRKYATQGSGPLACSLPGDNSPRNDSPRLIAQLIIERMVAGFESLSVALNAMQNRRVRLLACPAVPWMMSRSYRLLGQETIRLFSNLCREAIIPRSTAGGYYGDGVMPQSTWTVAIGKISKRRQTQHSARYAHWQHATRSLPLLPAGGRAMRCSGAEMTTVQRPSLTSYGRSFPIGAGAEFVSDRLQWHAPLALEIDVAQAVEPDLVVVTRFERDREHAGPAVA